MNCYVCDKEDWRNVEVTDGGVRRNVHRQSHVRVCKSCGNLAHKVDPAEEDNVKEYYRKEYRPAPGIPNLITTTHKQNYIMSFLREFMQSRKGRQMTVGDVGCATGYLLGHMKQLGHKVSGCEYTVTFRRMAEHYYGVPVAEELETKNRYDLIVIYHVLEHMVEPDKKLAHYASLLADGGHLLVSTPRWLHFLEEQSGGPLQDFDHLYHKDHINLFTEQSLRNLFKKCGLLVVKDDQYQYGQTYLLRKAASEELVRDWMTREDWVEVEKEVLRDYSAIALYKEGKLDEAIRVRRAFPEAWMAIIFGKCAKDEAKQADLIAEADLALQGNLRFKLAKAQWHYQHARIKEALELFYQIVNVRPNEDVFVHMGYCNAQLGKSAEAIKCFEVAQTMDPRKWQECQMWILKLVSEMPAWDERALSQAKEAVVKQAMSSGQLKTDQAAV